MLSTSPMQMNDHVHTSHFAAPAGMLCAIFLRYVEPTTFDFIVIQLFCMFCHVDAVFVYKLV